MWKFISTQMTVSGHLFHPRILITLLDLTKLSNEVWNCSWVTQLVDAVASCISYFTSAKPQWNSSFGYHLDGALMLPFRGVSMEKGCQNRAPCFELFGAAMKGLVNLSFFAWDLPKRGSGSPQRGGRKADPLGSIWSRGTVLAVGGVLIFTPLLLISSTLLQIAPSVVCQSCWSQWIFRYMDYHSIRSIKELFIINGWLISSPFWKFVLQWILTTERPTPQQGACIYRERERCSLPARPSTSYLFHPSASGMITLAIDTPSSVLEWGLSS